MTQWREINMNEITMKEGDLVIRDARIALLVSRFNGFVVDSLLAGALDTLKRHGADERFQDVEAHGAEDLKRLVVLNLGAA